VLKTAKGNRIAVFVLHLHPWGGPNNERMTEMRLDEIKGIVSKVRPYSNLPVLIIGDYNTGSHLDGVEGYKVTRYMEKQGYKDLYRTVHADPKALPGFTCSGSRIDYIFYNQHVKSIDCKVLKDGVFGSRGFGHSDHLAVFGVVKIDSAEGSAGGSSLSEQMHLIDPGTPQGLRELFAYNGEPLYFVSAHRGGPRRNYAENCIATFENTLRHTFAIMEIDPRYTRDGAIVVHHDATLERTTTGNGRVAELTLQELKELRLRDDEGAVTGLQIPTLDEVLKWARGKTVLVVDQKDVPVEDRLRKIAEHRAEAYVIMIVYSLKDARKCYEMNKNIMMEVMIPNIDKFHEFDKTGIPWSNVVAFVGHSRPKDEKLLQMIHAKGACCIAGTSRNLDRDLIRNASNAGPVTQSYRDLVQRGVDIIETDLPGEVGELLYGESGMPASRSKFLRRPRFAP
jgi:glycerophosphoryl diester phosphodiesterase